MNLSNEILLDEIHLMLEKKSTKDTVEILGNLFIRLGVKTFEKRTEKINWNNIHHFLLDDIKKNGDTYSNALVRQGIIILEWLGQKKDEPRE